LNGGKKMAFYKVVLNGQCQGQDVKNILYYRTGLGVDLSGFTLGGTRELATLVREFIWTAARVILPTAYRLESITASVYNDGTFDLLYQNPTVIGVGEDGLANGSLNGPATTAIINFSLEPTLIGANGLKPPKKGYIAFGPLMDTWINDDGTVRKDIATNILWSALETALTMDLINVLPPAVFFPVRMHQDKILGIFKFTSFADINGASVRNQSSWRRSRMPEA
jgi:hypothetical protein